MHTLFSIFKNRMKLLTSRLPSCYSYDILIVTQRLFERQTIVYRDAILFHF